MEVPHCTEGRRDLSEFENIAAFGRQSFFGRVFINECTSNFQAILLNLEIWMSNSYDFIRNIGSVARRRAELGEFLKAPKREQIKTAGSRADHYYSGNIGGFTQKYSLRCI